MGRPATGQKPNRNFRVSDDMWAQIREIADAENRSMTAVIVDALTRHIAWWNRQQRRTGR